MTKEQKRNAIEELEAVARLLEGIYLRYGLQHLTVSTFKDNEENLQTLINDIGESGRIRVWRDNRQTKMSA